MPEIHRLIQGSQRILRHGCTFDLELVPPELVETALVGLDS